MTTQLFINDMLRYYPEPGNAELCYRAKVCTNDRVFEIYAARNAEGHMGQYYPSLEDWLSTLPGSPTMDTVLINRKKPMSREQAVAILYSNGDVERDSDLPFYESWIKQRTHPDEYAAEKEAANAEKYVARCVARDERLRCREAKRKYCYETYLKKKEKRCAIDQRKTDRLQKKAKIQEEKLLWTAIRAEKAAIKEQMKIDRIAERAMKAQQKEQEKVEKQELKEEEKRMKAEEAAILKLEKKEEKVQKNAELKTTIQLLRQQAREYTHNMLDEAKKKSMVRSKEIIKAAKEQAMQEANAMMRHAKAFAMQHANALISTAKAR